MKWPARLFLQIAADGFCDVSAFLYGDGAHSRQWLAGLVQEHGSITDDQDLTMTGNREVRFDKNAARLVDRPLQRAYQRRSSDAGCPEYRECLDLVIAHPDCFRFHPCDRRTGVHLS